jgi:hypothetical protein
MGAKVSFTQVQTSGPCDESEDEKLELASTKTQLCKRQKRFFKRFWMQDLTQIHSRMHPLVSKESDLQRRTTPGTSETVTKSERLKQSLAAALRLASKKALLQATLSPISLKDNAEPLHRLSLFLPLQKKKPEQTNQSLRSPSATIPTTKNKNSLTNERKKDEQQEQATEEEDQISSDFCHKKNVK